MYRLKRRSAVSASLRQFTGPIVTTRPSLYRLRKRVSVIRMFTGHQNLVAMGTRCIISRKTI